LSGKSNRFAIDLADFIETCKFGKVVILASLPSTAQNGSGETIGDTRFRHARVVETSGGEMTGATFAFATDEDLRWTHLGACTIEPDSVPTDAPDKFSLPPWSLLRALAKVSSRKKTQGEKIALSLDVSCLVAVCSEGDNSDDAARAAETTSLFLEIQGARSHDVQEESFCVGLVLFCAKPGACLPRGGGRTGAEPPNEPCSRDDESVRVLFLFSSYTVRVGKRRP
jgi:hypothetical protein